MLGVFSLHKLIEPLRIVTTSPLVASEKRTLEATVLLFTVRDSLTVKASALSRQPPCLKWMFKSRRQIMARTF